MIVRNKYTKKNRMSDFDYFIKNYKKLYKKYGHTYIVIKDKNILGAYKNVNEAINSTKMPLGTYILQECNGKESGYTSYVTSFNLFKA